MFVPIIIASITQNLNTCSGLNLGESTRLVRGPIGTLAWLKAVLTLLA